MISSGLRSRAAPKDSYYEEQPRHIMYMTALVLGTMLHKCMGSSVWRQRCCVRWRQKLSDQQERRYHHGSSASTYGDSTVQHSAAEDLHLVAVMTLWWAKQIILTEHGGVEIELDDFKPPKCISGDLWEEVKSDVPWEHHQCVAMSTTASYCWFDFTATLSSTLHHTWRLQ